MAKYFGTDGIRGRFGGPLICQDFVYRLGVAIGYYLERRQPGKFHSIIVGQDTRSSGLVLCDALIAGLNQSKTYVKYASIVPTPAIARSILDQKADFGIVVTASHNPHTDNGIKLFDQDGGKLNHEKELIIEAILEEIKLVPSILPNPKSIYINVSSYYIDYFRSFLSQNSLSKWHIVLDLAHGATSVTTPRVLSDFGASLHTIGDQPNGENINDGFGSEFPEQLSLAVLEQNATIGIAHDGDGDRLVICDEKGVIVNGDVILGLFGRYAMQNGSLKSGVLVTTIHSNLALDQTMHEVGGKVERVEVGDRNVAKRMYELGANIGGESSGHIIFSDFATTGDGLIAAIKIIELMQMTGKRLSELREEIVLFPQLTLNLNVTKKIPLDQLKSLKTVVKKIQLFFKDEGRVLVRYSGTESKLRLLVEAKNKNILYDTLKEIERAARADLVIIDD